LNRKLVVIGLLVCISGFSHARIVNGVYDLRMNNFETPVELNGKWEFYWGQLLAPDEIMLSRKEYCEFPSLWNDQVIGNDTLSNIGFATYRLKVVLPADARSYALLMQDTYCAYRLYVNGKIVAENGGVAEKREDYSPQWLPGTFLLDDISGSLDLVLQIANFDHSKGGAMEPILLGEKQQILEIYNLQRFYDISLTLFFLFLALFFLFRYVYFSLGAASLYFSLFCFAYSYRIIGTGLYVLHAFIPGIPWKLAVHLEYLTLFVSPYFFAKYLFSLYPEETKKWAVNVIGLAALVFSLLTILTPILFFTQLILPFFIFLVIAFFYAFMIFTQAAFNRRKGSVFGIVSVAVVFTVFTYMMFVYFGWLDPENTVIYYGYVLFLVFQSLQLFHHSKKDKKVTQ